MEKIIDFVGSRLTLGMKLGRMNGEKKINILLWNTIVCENSKSLW